MIKGKEVCLTYPDGTNGLFKVDLNIPTGKLVFITGPSGSGKTSLLKLVIGSELPTAGFLNVLGFDLNNINNKNIRKMRRLIGPVFQDFRLIKGRTVLENVVLGMRFLDLPMKSMKEDAINTLTRVGLEHKIYSKVENLSWGETQRVAIARAVVRKPLLILADEPTGNLDKENAINIINLLSSFKDNNTTVMITTHATHLIEDIKEAVYLQMERGCIK